MKTTTVPQLLTTSDAARALKVSRVLVWQWAKTRKLQPVACTRLALLFAPADVQALRDAREQRRARGSRRRTPVPLKQ